MPELVSLERRLLITAAQWLTLLIEETGLDPAAISMESVTVAPNGRKIELTVTLAETLEQINALTVTTINYSDNDQ